MEFKLSDQFKLPDQKSLIYLIIAAVFAAAVFAVVMTYIYFSFKTTPSAEVEAPVPKENIIKQKEELDRLREEAGSQPPTEEELAQQVKELDALRETAKDESLSEEELQQQKEELDRLREEAKKTQ